MKKIYRKTLHTPSCWRKACWKWLNSWKKPRNIFIVKNHCGFFVLFILWVESKRSSVVFANSCSAWVGTEAGRACTSTKWGQMRRSSKEGSQSSLSHCLYINRCIQECRACHQNDNYATVCTANEGLLRIQYKCLVPIYVFPEMKLCSILISKTDIMFCLPVPIIIYSICERFIFFQDRSVYFAAAKYVDRYWEYLNRTDTWMWVEIGTEAAQFPENEYINGIFVAVWD